MDKLTMSVRILDMYDRHSLRNQLNMGSVKLVIELDALMIDCSYDGLIAEKIVKYSSHSTCLIITWLEDAWLEINS